MKKNKKGLAVFGLLALCVILVAGVFILGQSPKGEDVLLDGNEPGKDVTPGGIAELPAVTTPDVKPSVIPPNADGQGGGSDIPLTVITDKPEPPELPDTAYMGEPPEEATPDDVKDHEALDPALKNPGVKPDVTPAPVELDKPKDNTPQSGDTNGSGEIYIPGFGWVKNEGGGGQGQQSQLDPDHADFDKIIGH